jgi:uncharacterized protein YacL
MTWHWIFLAGVVRLIFLLAPLKMEKGFALHGPALDEAKELVNAAAIKAMLLSLPAVFFVNVMAEADKNCRTGVSPFRVILYGLLGVAIGFLVSKMPSWMYRGRSVPYIWFIILTLVEVLAQAFGLSPAVRFVCKS